MNTQDPKVIERNVYEVNKSQSLYSMTGDIKHVNTMMVNRHALSEIPAHIDKLRDENERLHKDAERKPMTDKDIATAIVRSPDPMAFGKLPADGWRPMVRAVEAFHGIKGTP